MSFLGRFSPKQRLWGTIGGVIAVGSIFKVGYFKYCREVLVDHADQSHMDATESLREAREFAAWSSKQRQEAVADLPELTDEQRQQMRAYLRMMQEYHVLNPDSEHPDYKPTK